jgi:hypothetical protein
MLIKPKLTRMSHHQKNAIDESSQRMYGKKMTNIESLPSALVGTAFYKIYCEKKVSGKPCCNQVISSLMLEC